MFLIEYIKEQQVNFPRLYFNPFSVLKLLLFEKEIKIENGKFLKEFTSYNRNVSFEVFYEEKQDLSEMIKREEALNSKKMIEENYYINKEYLIFCLNKYGKENSHLNNLYQKRLDNLKEEIEQTYINRYNKVDFISEYELKDLKRKNFWKDMLNKYEYNICLNLSLNNFNACFFNKNTDNDLLKITIALFFALIEYMEALLIDLNFEDKISLCSYKFKEKEVDYYKKIYPSDINILKDIITKCQSYIN